MNAAPKKLILQDSHWYAWQMIPGYAGERNVPYFSPIYVQSVKPKKTGHKILNLRFINVFYAEGVQDFNFDMKIIKHSADYLVAEILYGRNGPDRTAIISHIEFQWIEQCCPGLWYHRPPSSVGGASTSSVSIYLSEVFGLGDKTDR
jgi:hypothetical protein